MANQIPAAVLVDLAAGRLQPEQALAVIRTVENEPDASALLDTAIDVFNASQLDGLWVYGESTDGNSSEVRQSLVRRWWARTAGASNWRLVSAIAGLAMLFMAGLVWWYPPSDSLAEDSSISDQELHFPVRGGRVNEIEWASHLLSTGHALDAAKTLEWYIRAFGSSPKLDVVHFLAGVSWMRSSQHTVLGLYQSVDEELVRRAIIHFEFIRADSPSEELRGETQWYKARAHLMIGELEEAAEILEGIHRRGRSHADEAEHLLHRLHH